MHVVAAPDLQVTDIQTSCAGAQGEAFAVTWTVTNNGTGPVSGTWPDQILLSDDGVIGSDTALIAFSHTDDLAVGESYTRTEMVTLPGGALGEHRIVVVTDVNDDVDEYAGESNNAAIDDESFYIHTPDVVSLCSWSPVDYEGGGAGNWVVAADGLSVHQTINGNPAYFVSDFDLAGSQFQGSFQVQGGAGDDDFIGFVFGFKGLGGTAVGEGYYIFSWKKGNQTYQGYAEAGFKVLKIIGPNPNLWDGEATSGQIEELARLAGSNSYGWQHDVEYEFFLTYQVNGNIRVIIRRASDDQEMWNTGLINDPDPLGPGKVGFWNYSQPHVIYAGFTQTELQPPVAIAGGPYTFDSATASVTLDATASFDPDGDLDTFEDIESVQWDLGDDGIGDDVDRVNPLEIVDLVDATDKGLAIGADVAVGLEVTDVDGLSGLALTSISYQSTSPTADADGPYGPIGPSEVVELAGVVDDVDLPLGVGEALTVEWDFAPATVAGQVGDGFASEADAVVSYETLLPLVTQHGETIYLNVVDAAGLVASASTTISLLSPDLTPTSLGAPGGGYTGEAFEVTFSVENVGTALAVGTWVDRIYISSDAEVGSDTLLGEETFPSGQSLYPSFSYDVLREVNLPDTPGDYWIIVVIDAADNVPELDGEDNNVAVSVGPIVVVQVPTPDLEVTSVLAPATATGGDTVTIEYTVENVGTATATVNWQDVIYLSDDAILDGGDQLLRLSPMSEAPLEPGGSYSVSRTAVLPVSYEATTAYMIVKTDNSDVVEELDEANNILASDLIAVEITPAPDLVGGGVSAPATAVFGEEITVDWWGENIGMLSAESLWSDLVFLSADEQLDTGDRFLGVLPIDAAPLVPGNPAYEALLVVDLPLNVQTSTGEYYILVLVDGNNAIEELDETNNLASYGPVWVELPPLPNLEIADISGQPTVAVGESVHVEWNVNNTGGEPTEGSFLMTVYVSPDGQVGGDTPLLNVVFEDALGAGTTVPQAADVTIPELGTDQLFFIICADTVLDVLESNENDNCTVSAVASPYDRPDLTVTVLSAPGSAVAEGTAQIDWTVENAGDATAVPYWIDAVYLSNDAAFGNDILLRTEARAEALATDTDYAVQATVTIPSDLAGSYYFIVETDRGDRLTETGDPANNVRVADAPTEITQPDRPNLLVTDVAAPDAGVGGQPVTVEWTVTNDGIAAAGGYWIDRVVASLDDQLSGDDLVLGTAQSVTPLNPTESYANEGTFEYPSVPGDYYIIVTTDAMNAVHEGLGGGEDDNTTSDDATFTVTSFTATAQADIEDAVAGTPVTITGLAVVEGTSDPAVGVPVVVQASVRGFERRFTQRSDESGEYEVVFQPGPTEGGLYGVSAGPQHASDLPADDQFRLWAMLATPNQVGETVVPGIPKTGQFSLKNPGDLPLTGIEMSISGAVAGVDVQVQIPAGNELAGLQTKAVEYTITAVEDVPVPDPIQIDFTSDQGATTAARLWIDISPAVPTLIVAPEDLISGKVSTVMARGERSYVQFQVRNIGGAATSELDVALPAVPWITLATPAPLAALGPGVSAAIVVQLDPPVDLILGPYSGSFVVQGDSTSVSVPFHFVNTSIGVGDLKVRATDEFTYYAEGEPPVVGALVSVRDYLSNDLVAQGYTDADGEILFDNLTEAYYDIEVTAEEHGSFRTTILAVAAELTEIEAFMPRQVVSYTWTVVPIDYEDEYRITIEAEFETQVPAPVVTIAPTSVDLANLTLPAQVNFTVTNYGLITADNVEFGVDGGEAYELIPLVTEIGDLPGGCTPNDTSGPCRVTVPVLVIPIAARGSGSCSPASVWECHELTCGNQTYRYCGWSVLFNGDCSGGGGNGGGGGGCWWCGWGGGGPGGGGNGGGGDPAFNPPSTPTTPLPCDPCDFKCATSAISCIPGAGCPTGLITCGVNLSGSQSGRQVIGGLFGCAGAVLNCLISLTPLASQLSCACALLRDCVADCQGPAGSIPCNPGDVLGSIGGWISGSRSALRAGDPIHDFYEQMFYEGYGILAVMAEIYGDDVWLLELGPDDVLNYQAWMGAFDLAVKDDSDEAEDISGTERQTLLSTPYPSYLNGGHVNTFIDRWNRSLWYWDQGILSAGDLPTGWDPDFIDYERLAAMHGHLVAAEEDIVAQGFTDPMEAFVYARDVLIADRTQGSEGICATVRIQIDQTVMVTRSAFRATLELENQGDDPLEGVFVEVLIKDENGELANDRFGVFPPDVEGLSDVDGGGSIAGGATGTASWVILPTDEAAPLKPTPYWVSGTLMYELGGDLVTVPLFPVRIDVLPNPNLEMKYFLETVVYSDDPFTPELEPAIPFSLGLMVKNSGAGITRNMHITSAQPEIIENERGLLIDFDIIGTQVGLEEVSPSLTVNLGDIGPDDVAVARWLMISTLQGEFVSYEASFEHINSLGDPRLSLIESVDIFGLNHVVLTDEPANDGLPDFLTNDFPDLRDLPDRVHLSDGTVEPVSPELGATVTLYPAKLGADVDVVMPEGWVYIRVDDPYDAQYRLASVVRLSDAKPIIVGYNAWQTDRVNRLEPGSPVERWLHIFDQNGGGQYMLSFDPDSWPPEVLTWQSVLDYGAELGEIGLAIDPTAPASEPRGPGISKLVITFDESVLASTFTETNVFVDGFDLRGNDVDLSGVGRTVTLQSGDKVGMIEFSPALPTNARYCIMLTGVTDRSDNPLAGHGSRIDLTSLPGDATGDRRVNNTDVGGVGLLLGTDPISRDELHHLRSDINCDGRIDQLDVDIVLAARGAEARFVSHPCLTRSGVGKWGRTRKRRLSGR